MRVLSLVALAAMLCLSARSATAGILDENSILLPSEFAGGYLLDQDTYDAQAKVAKEARKLMAGLAKCYSKGVKNITKGRASGLDVCLHHTKRGVMVKYAAKTAPYAAQTTCWGSPGTPGPTELGAAILGFVKGLNSQYLYCVSPSGAFLDSTEF